MKINIQKFARVYLSRFLALVCAVMVLFVSLPSASASEYGDQLRGYISLDNGSWIGMTKPGDDIGFNFDYNGTYGTLPFNIRFDVDNLDSNGKPLEYDYVEWLIYTEVVSIDSLTAYTLYTENVLPIEVSYLDGDPFTDANGDSGYPIRRLISVRVDTSAMDWSLQEPVLRMYGTFLSDAGYTDQVVSVWDVVGGFYEYDVTPETTWLEKILNSVSSGFSSVADFLSNIFNSMVSGFDRVIELLDEFVNGSEEDREQIEQSKGEIESAGNDLTNAGNALDSLDRPEVQLDTFVPTELTGAMYLAYVNCVQIFWNEPTLLAMITILASIILLSYLLHGEKG